ncbi:hypothetical protein SLS53_006479 [Cytospora paraplurivora]|uniref:Uncharacterized protein n=1 Tax=Cytospora paraplurivora TaxID=2898453 RepID=A0AAN9U4L6_9PEZI
MLFFRPLWGALIASLIVGATCSNDFVKSKFPSEFGQDTETEYYWDNLKGYIAGIRVVSAAQDDSDDNWILAYANNGSAYFGGNLGVYSDGTQVPLGSGYTLQLLWTDSDTYDDIDDVGSESTSPEFSIVPNKEDDSTDSGSSGLTKGEKAGIAVAVILVVLIVILLLWWKIRKHKKSKKRKLQREAEKGEEDRRWAPPPNGPGLGQGTWKTWDAIRPPGKIGATATESTRIGKDGKAYLDNKVELAGDSTDPHKPNTQGLFAASNQPELDATSTAVAAVELPAEPLGPHGADGQPGRASGLFHYDPRPSYALLSATSPTDETRSVSPVSPHDSATVGTLDSAVSPVTPISRKPVGGSVSRAPADR